MMRETKSHTKLGVSMEALWDALSKDLQSILPRVIPHMVKTVEIIEGDGGFGTTYLLNFVVSDKSSLKYQKEKVVIFDESKHEFGLQVIEGGHLNHGFSSYTIVVQLTAIGDAETLVDFKVVYKQIIEDKDTQMPDQTIKSYLSFLNCLEKYLLEQDS